MKEPADSLAAHGRCLNLLQAVCPGSMYHLHWSFKSVLQAYHAKQLSSSSDLGQDAWRLFMTFAVRDLHVCMLWAQKIGWPKDLIDRLMESSPLEAALNYSVKRRSQQHHLLHRTPRGLGAHGRGCRSLGASAFSDGHGLPSAVDRPPQRSGRRGPSGGQVQAAPEPATPGAAPADLIGGERTGAQNGVGSESPTGEDGGRRVVSSPSSRPNTASNRPVTRTRPRAQRACASGEKACRLGIHCLQTLGCR